MTAIKARRAAKRARRAASPLLDRFQLYERAVTAAGPLARFLQAVHDGPARVLGEDFSGTGALARAWVELHPEHRAVAVDRDREALARIAHVRVKAVCADVLRAKDRCDIIAATNFPICYWHTREDLVAYLRHVRSRLNGRGVFVADLYGGSDAFRTGTKSVKLRVDGRVVTYTWEQRAADPVSGRVLNAIHFRVGRRVLKDAFVYDWRLWSIPELTDAMHEAGFRGVEVYDELGGAVDERGRVHARPADRLSDPWVVYVVARR